VVGFDLAGDEVRYPAPPHAPAFAAARAAGLRLTCHAGEAGEPANVEDALRLGVERIAHGVTAARDEGLIERIRREGVVLDMCPTVNWKCKAIPRLEDHPMPGLVRGGVRCTISTDSRTVGNTTLTHEYEVLAALGMTDDQLRACNETAYAAKFG
jgi:adenosine deaminase